MPFFFFLPSCNYSLMNVFLSIILPLSMILGTLHLFFHCLSFEHFFSIYFRCHLPFGNQTNLSRQSISLSFSNLSFRSLRHKFFCCACFSSFNFSHNVITFLICWVIQSDYYAGTKSSLDDSPCPFKSPILFHSLCNKIVHSHIQYS